MTVLTALLWRLWVLGRDNPGTVAILIVCGLIARMFAKLTHGMAI